MRHRFIFISMTFLGILFASCNDWLDVQPEDQRKEDDITKDIAMLCRGVMPRWGIPVFTAKN